MDSALGVRAPLSCVLTNSEPQKTFSDISHTGRCLLLFYFYNSSVRHCVLKIHKEHLKNNENFVSETLGLNYFLVHQDAVLPAILLIT